MKKYEVYIPITGQVCVDVEVPDDFDPEANGGTDLYMLACETWDENKHGPAEWEFTEKVSSGNVCNAILVEWEWHKKS